MNISQHSTNLQLREKPKIKLSFDYNKLWSLIFRPDKSHAFHFGSIFTILMQADLGETEIGSRPDSRVSSNEKDSSARWIHSDNSSSYNQT